MNIYALSSGGGPSGIAIIRLTGNDALNISELITKKKKLKSKEINFCKFYNPSNNTLIDEGLLLLFPNPNSFTGEDLVEFHVHGSNAVISYFLRVLSEQDNCRLAEAGEFTKIAFQNNKVDLSEPIIIEVKQSGLNRNSKINTLLRSKQIRPQRLSKYCIGCILLDDKLKYNRFKSRLLDLNKIQKIWNF